MEGQRTTDRTSIGHYSGTKRLAQWHKAACAKVDPLFDEVSRACASLRRAFARQDVWDTRLYPVWKLDNLQVLSQSTDEGVTSDKRSFTKHFVHPG